MLKTGQVVVFEMDGTRSSLELATLIRSKYTHIVLALEDGDDPSILHTYPGTNAIITNFKSIAKAREFTVLDPGAIDLARLVGEARRLVGDGYWWSPCSRLTALAFRRAGIDLQLDTNAGGWRERNAWFTPEEFITRMRLFTTLVTGAIAG